jgi:hypothetical protein
MTTQLMLDSGAWSAYTQKTTIKIGDYIDYIRRRKRYLEIYFNLDVIGDGENSYNNWVHMRANGLEPIPVYHIGTPESFLENYLEHCDHIAIGAIADMSTEKRMESLNRIWVEYLTDSKGFPKVKVHGFGLTSIRVMKSYPWYSVDSTSWVMFGRYGAILVPKTKNGHYVYDDNPFIVSVSSKSPKQKKYGEHFNTFNEDVQEKILDYIYHMGFKMGVTNHGEEQEILEEGLSNVHYQRDQINMLYYLGVQESMPEWPWSWSPSRQVLF